MYVNQASKWIQTKQRIIFEERSTSAVDQIFSTEVKGTIPTIKAKQTSTVRTNRSKQRGLQM